MDQYGPQVSVTDGLRILLRNRRHVKQYKPDMAVPPQATEVKVAMGTVQNVPSMATSTSPPGRVPTEDPSTVVIPEQSSQTLTDSASSETPPTPASNPDRNSSTAKDC